MCVRVTAHIQRTSVEDNTGRFTPSFSADADHFNHVSSSRIKAFKGIRPMDTYTHARTHTSSSKFFCGILSILLTNSHKIKDRLTCGSPEKQSAPDWMLHL